MATGSDIQLRIAPIQVPPDVPARAVECSAEKRTPQQAGNVSETSGESEVHEFHDPSAPRLFNPLFGSAFDLDTKSAKK